MCGRYVVSTELEKVQNSFQNQLLQTKMKLSPNYFVLPSETTPVISSINNNLIVPMTFGFPPPSWSKSKSHVINARSEGILSKPYFRNSIRNKRCLIIADAIIEGPEKEKLKNPFLIYPRDKKRPFAMAGIWNNYICKNTGIEKQGFSIVTTKSNKIMDKIGHHRSPVIVPNNMHNAWLDNTTPINIITSVFLPFDSNKWNGFSIDPQLMKTKTALGIAATSEKLYYEPTPTELFNRLRHTPNEKRKRKKGEP